MTVPVEVLEQSFDLVAPRGDELVDRLYDNIFAAAPAALALFADADRAEQKKKLLATLIVVRKSLRNLEAIVPALQTMGARHARYGVLPEHYPVVGAALLDAMATIGGENWRPEYTEAWAGAYQIVQETMLSGAMAPI